MAWTEEATLTELPENRERLLDVWLGLTGQAPLPEGPLVLPVLSGSMRPSIPLGSRILIKPGSPQQCRVGDVAVYIDDDRLVAHRLLWRWGSRCFMKGDANRWGHWIPFSRFRGKVAEVLPAEDVASTFPGKNPFSEKAARDSRKQYLGNILLFLPRLAREVLSGHRSNPDKDT